MKFLLSSKEEFYACKEFSWLLRCVTGELCSLSPCFSPQYVSGGSGGLSAHRLPSDASRIVWDPELPPRAGELAPREAGQTDRPAPWSPMEGRSLPAGDSSTELPLGGRRMDKMLGGTALSGSVRVIRSTRGWSCTKRAGICHPVKNLLVAAVS